MSKEQKAGNMKLKIYFMIKIYFKTAGRNLIKNKVSSFINISGLAIGMAVAILIGLWIWDELSFDTCNKNYNAIAQVARKEILNGDAYVSNNNNHFPIPLAGELRMNYNNLFKHVSLTTEKGKHIIDFNGNKFSEQGMYVEKDFTNMFTLNMTAGTSADFSDPNSILLSKSVAQALFVKTDPVGKVVKLDNDQPLKVSAVFEDLPQNSSFSEVNFFCPWSLLVNTNKGAKDNLDNWVIVQFTFLRRLHQVFQWKKYQVLLKIFTGKKLKTSRCKQRAIELISSCIP